MANYSNRFGFAKKLDNAYAAEPNNEYLASLRGLRDAIHVSKRGALTGVRDVQGKLRLLVRGFYGFRHKSEQILKAMHDAYLEYAKTQVVTDHTNAVYSLNTFFGSQQYQRRERANAR